MVTFFYLSYVHKWDIETRRLIQINPSETQDAGLLITFVSLLLIGFFAKLLLLYSKRPLFSKAEMGILSSAISRLADGQRELLPEKKKSLHQIHKKMWLIFISGLLYWLQFVLASLSD